MLDTDCITVLTARGITEILNSGGSQAWRLDATHVAKLPYLVCVQNSKKTGVVRRLSIIMHL